MTRYLSEFAVLILGFGTLYAMLVVFGELASP